MADRDEGGRRDPTDVPARAGVPLTVPPDLEDDETVEDLDTFEGTAEETAESDEDESAGGEIDDVALPAGKYSEVTAGFMHTCGILEGSGAAGTVVCAGGVEGQSKPGANTAKSIAAGVILSCSLGLDGQAACWGGDGATPPSGKKFVALAVGLRLACGLPAGGDPVCWGETDSSAAP